MNSMPVLLQINVFGNKGSHGKIAESIGKLAIEHGWRSVIAYGRAANPSANELIRVGNDMDIREHVLESRLLDNHGLASRKATRCFIKQIEELKPDIIHLHVIHGYYLNYKLLFEYLNSINTPVVWTFHDTWAYTGHCGHYGSINCEKWKIQCGACPLMWKDYPKAIIDRSTANYELKKKLFIANKNLHIVTVSEWLKKEVEQSFFKYKDIRVIRNGVSIDVFKRLSEVSYPKIEDRIQGKFVLLGVSSIWGPVKGLEEFIRLSGVLSSDVIIVLVGVTDAQRKQLPNNIIGLMRTDSIEELVQLYNVADVTLSLSKAETFGLTIAESFACGTPAIVYNSTSLPELITEDTGFAVDYGDFKGLKDAISIIKNKGKRHFSRKCRERAESLYDQDKAFMNYINLYEELLHE